MLCAMLNDPERLFAHPLFQRVDAVGRAEVTAKVSERSFAPGRVIVSEGALAESLYIVLAGSVEIFTEPEPGKPVILAQRHAGDHFGEQALLPGRTGYRSASVRALTEVSVAEVPAGLLRRLLTVSPQLEAQLQRLGHTELQQRMRLKCQAIHFLNFGVEDLARLGSEDFAPGQLLIRQGDPSEKLFVILSGDVEVSEDKGARRRILHRLSAGQCVGELGLATRSPRSASVRAITRVETVTITEAHFHDLLERAPALREHVKTLQRCLSLREDNPGAATGFLTQYAGFQDGQECVTTACRMDDGRHVVASLLVLSGTYHVEVTRPGAAAGAARLVRSPAAGEVACEVAVVTLADGSDRVESATAAAHWPDVRLLHRMVLDDSPWTGAIEQAFVEQGRLPPPGQAVAEDDPNLICACMRVGYDQALDAVLSSCADLAELGRVTGCGTVCGGCKPRLAQLLGDPGCAPVVLQEVVPLTDQVRALRLLPRASSGLTFKPGQHVWLEGWIGGHWVRRSYTLSAPPAAQGLLEVSVKLEPQGVLSPWLWDLRAGDKGLRVSAPLGQALFASEGGQPWVCLVAGIGITPALAAWRCWASDPNHPRSLIHYSVRTAEQAAWLQELQALAAADDHLQLVLRETARQGRLAQADVHALIKQHPRAHFLVCGPAGYLANTQAALDAAGVPASQIHSQRFSTTDLSVAGPSVPHAATVTPWTWLEQTLRGFMSNS